MSIKHFFLLLSFCTFSLHARTKPFTIMLDPAGDAQHAGRQIDDYTERGGTLSLANDIKESIENTHTGVRVVLTRFPGETIQPRQNASFANRLDVDLYISLHLFKQKNPQAQMYIFYFCSDPTTDFWFAQTPELAFVRSNEIHKQSIKKSKAWAALFFETVQQYSNTFITSKPLGIPFKPLYGMKSPSIGIEVSLAHSEEWKHYVQPITDGITALILNKKQSKGSRGFFS